MSTDHCVPIHNRVLARHSDYCVMSRRIEVMWDNGSTAHLHEIYQGAGVPMFLRAVQLPDGGWMVIDLRRVLPGLAAEVERLQMRNAVTTIFYRLRRTFPGATAFRQRAAEHFVAAWAGPISCELAA